MPDTEKSMTVAEVADLLRTVTPDVTRDFLSRQIRNWAKLQLFGPLLVAGAGPTSPQVFELKHAVMARIFNALTNMGMSAPQLTVVARLLNNTPLEEHPVGVAFERGLPLVINLYHRGDQDWRLIIYA